LSKRFAGEIAYEQCTLQYLRCPSQQLILPQGHSFGQDHGLGRLWESPAIASCISFVTTPIGFGVLQNLGDIVPFIEIDLQKS
jgi:hypothetical protein